MNKTGSQIYIERANQRRGEFLNRCIAMERAMDRYIADYFVSNTDERNLELLFLVISSERMAFENKRQVAQWIAENKDKLLLKTYPSIFKDIQQLIEFRNLIAHSVLDFEGFHKKNENAITTLITYRHKVKRKDLTEEECTKWQNIASHYQSVFAYWKPVPMPVHGNPL